MSTEHRSLGKRSATNAGLGALDRKYQLASDCYNRVRKTHQLQARVIRLWCRKHGR